MLDACHMDETMAIERILNGTGLSSWSEVSKKKKKPPSNNRSTSRAHNATHSDRDRDRRDRRDRDRSTAHASDSAPPSNGLRRNSANRHYTPRSKDPVSRKRPQVTQPSSNPPHPSTSSNAHVEQSSPSRTPFTETTQAWLSPGTDVWLDSIQPNDGGDARAADAHASPDSAEQSWPESSQPSPPAAPNAWAAKDAIADTKQITQAETAAKDDNAVAESTSVSETQSKSPAPVPSVKRTFNYAAAVAAGTSHEKPAPVVPERVSPISQQSAVESEVVSSPPAKESVPEMVAKPDVAETRTTRSPVARPVRPASTEVEKVIEPSNERRPAVSANGTSGEVAEGSTTAETTPTKSPVKVEARLESPSASSNAWASRPVDVKEDKPLQEAATAVAVASAGIGNESSGDALSLQFGSFGLGGLDVNWSAPEQKGSESISTPTTLPTVVANEPASAPTVGVAKQAPKAVTSPVVPAVTAAAPPANAVVPNAVVGAAVPGQTGGATSVALENAGGLGNGQDVPVANNGSSGGLHLPAVSSGGNGSGMFPMLAMGPGGNFAPANYAAPYLVPPLHGYSPALGNYENGSELGSSRAGNLAPSGSLPLYDPSNLPGMGSANGKYGGIPGLGDMSALGGVQSGVGKDGLQMNGGDMEKANGLGTSGLGTGMDALAAPYMMPGYASMQYPMYTFPTGPYGPPGMAPPGPSPFPYAAAGQVSSGGGRGGFGFDDGNVGLSGNSRTGNGLAESMYTPGAYLNNSMSHNVNNVNQKGGADGAYKAVRGNGGAALGGGMSMGGGMVAGMGYGGDYASGMGGVGNGGVGSNVGAPGGWGNRQGNGIRADGNGGGGVVSNGAMGAGGGAGGSGGGAGGAGGGHVSSGGYAGGPGVGAGAGGNAYWTQQQGGYYP